MLRLISGWRHSNSCTPVSSSRLGDANAHISESDRVSQYLIKSVIYYGDQSPDEVFFRLWQATRWFGY